MKFSMKLSVSSISSRKYTPVLLQFPPPPPPPQIRKTKWDINRKVTNKKIDGSFWVDFICSYQTQFRLAVLGTISLALFLVGVEPNTLFTVRLYPNFLNSKGTGRSSKSLGFQKLKFSGKKTLKRRIQF